MDDHMVVPESLLIEEIRYKNVSHKKKTNWESLDHIAAYAALPKCKYIYSFVTYLFGDDVQPSRHELHLQFLMPVPWIWSTTIQVTGTGS